MLTDQAGQRRFTGACPGTAMAGPGDAENHLIGVTAPGVASTLSYDPIGRLNHIVTNGTATNFVWDGDDLLVEYDATSTNVLRRFIHGPGDDNPLIWFEGSYMDQTHQQLLIADHQGSIVGVTNAAGALTSSLTYDPYGSTPSFAGPRFRYTGQIAIPEIGLYYYKARFYDPVAQRFLQTDPVGMTDDENLYAYVRDDPVDRSDPTGLRALTDGESTMASNLGLTPQFVSLYKIPKWIMSFGGAYATTFPWEIDFSSQVYKGDFSADSTIFGRELLYHEFFHLFQNKTEIRPWLGQAAGQITNSANYEWNPKQSWQQQSSEAQAQAFGQCAGSGSGCGKLEGQSVSGHGSSLSYSKGVFTLTTQVTGSRIPQKSSFAAPKEKAAAPASAAKKQ